ncbi:MAG: hypothetical protein PHD15_02845 [Clostridia bacterium]|nr:hypothetical protein [Clostridia bacterium]MDD4386682.1 hypothetical protein [Clostridia bacterium]
MLEFWKNEWELLLNDLTTVKKTIKKMFGVKEELLMLNIATEEVAVDEEKQVQEQVYENDAIDHKVTAYFGEDIDTVRQNTSGDKTQHEVLRGYAQYFKPYIASHEMCNSAFRKYYDRHVLEIATSDIPVDQLRIVQNNVDIFIGGQEVFGDNGQFIDSRVDTIFKKVGEAQICKMVNILHDNTDNLVNTQGERLFAESIHYMVDNGIKIDKDGDLIKPIKTVLEDKLNSVHTSLRNHEDWNDEYQKLLSDERKYLYALNRIEQFETEQKISEFESKLESISLPQEV